MTTDEKNIKAIVETGEVEKYSAEFFKRKGNIGGKKRWEGKTPDEIKAYMSAIAKKPRKKRRLSTD
jgi:hypothetical protein